MVFVYNFSFLRTFEYRGKMADHGKVPRAETSNFYTFGYLHQFHMIDKEFTLKSLSEMVLALKL